MATFNYTAKTSTGQVVTGRFDATDKGMVVSLLRGKGYYPVEISELTTAQKDIDFSALTKIKIKDLAIFCRQFSTMMNAGVSVVGCLDMLRKQTENKKLAGIITKVYDEVQRGATLSDSLKAHSKDLPVILISMLEVGEVSGTLDSVLERLSVHFEKENRINQKIQTAMMYPMVIGVIAVLVVVGLMIFIVPVFVSMFNSVGGQLPLPTRILLWISGLMKNPIFLIGAPLVIFMASFMFKKYKSTENGKFVLDSLTLKIPLVGGNVRKILASRFTRTLSALLNTGVPLIQALEVVDRVVDNQVVTRGLIKVREDIKRGSNLAGPLEAIGIFPAMVTQMINVGEESGSIDSIMVKVADFYDDELDASISRLIALLEPVMIVVIAGIVGFIVVAMIMPIFSMYNNMS